VGVANLTVNHLQFMVGRDVPLTGLRDWTARRHPLRVPSIAWGQSTVSSSR
jgi:hypothetical protein